MGTPDFAVPALEKLYELENLFADRSKASGLIEALAASAEREEE